MKPRRVAAVKKWRGIGEKEGCSFLKKRTKKLLTIRLVFGSAVIEN
jgi:hypothetical protein